MKANLILSYFWRLYSMDLDEHYMLRCLQLAALGAGAVAPNPMVGAVLVHQGRIIGEGYHQEWGGPHAEVNCLSSVSAEHKELIPNSTLYVSLEPCAHFGKTPPCADLIIKNRIPKVVVACRDPFSAVNGKGLEKMQSAGVAVKAGVLEKEAKELNRRFFLFHTLHRPYVLLKWAQTADGRLRGKMGERLHISNPYTNRLVHRWRSEEMSILVGTNTAVEDDPELTTRHWPGQNPIRLVIDRDLSLPESLKLFDGKFPTLVFTNRKHSLPDQAVFTDVKKQGLAFYQVSDDASLVPQILNALYQLRIQSVMVEGGAQLLQSFIDENSWDEARVITNEKLVAGEGLAAPRLDKACLINEESIFSDTLQFFRNAAGDYTEL
jgi:diaminohydroxyphosphoribosylaminopyrimidine deaminase/5-amino-6-(5-phosphoribosylamino)uracil reductase